MLLKLFTTHLFTKMQRCLFSLKLKILNFTSSCFRKTINFTSSYIKKYDINTSNYSKHYEVTHHRLSAIGSIEMILILLVLISLIVIFKSQITSIFNSIFRSIKEEIDGLL